MFRHLSNRKSLFFMIIGLIIFCLYLYFFVGFKELLYVMENLNSADYVFYYSLAIVAMVLSVFFVAAAWHDLLKSLSAKMKLLNVFLYTWAGYSWICWCPVKRFAVRLPEFISCIRGIVKVMVRSQLHR